MYSAVLGEDSLVEYALRQTLVADAVSLQFRLPPPGVPPPVSRRSPAIAHNTPVVDTLVITSVWAVHLLRTLSQVIALCYGRCVSPEIARFQGSCRIPAASDTSRMI